MFELVKVLMSLVTLAVIVKVSKRNLIYLNFLLYALWLRFTLSAFHQFTIDPIVMGLSINALSSIAVAGIGILLLPKRILLLKKLFFLYMFIGAIILSSLLNFEITSLVNVLVKWLYFIVIAISIALCIRALNLSTTLKYLLIPFILPVGLQVLSIVLGEFKATERDGSVSYIGGYHHEASFSMILLCASFILAFLERGKMQYRGLCFLIVIGLLVLANYRTAILAVLPVTLVFIFAYTEKVKTHYRIMASSILMIAACVPFFLAWILMSERFSDIGLFLSSWQDLIKEPQYFAYYERAVFSSRVYIWSQYLTVYFNAPIETQLFGFGPESWRHYFPLYAHNTYVSYLFEYGMLGLLAFVCFIVSIFYYAFNISGYYLKIKVIAAFAGFLILNMATMPIWAIEGLIIFAVIFGSISGYPYSRLQTMFKNTKRNFTRPARLQ